MHLCTCEINLGGDGFTILPAIPEYARTYPEIALLRHLHGGEDLVKNIRVIGVVNRTPAQERDRLRETYGSVADELYPGVMPMMPMDASGDEFYKGNDIPPPEVEEQTDIEDEPPARAARARKAEPASPFATI